MKIRWLGPVVVGVAMVVVGLNGPPAAAAPIARYVALGDSYSSGEGTGDYDPGTDRALDRCHRSPEAYARLIAAADPSVGRLRFRACSGAVTADLTRPNHLYPGEPPQRDALMRATRTVSLTIGGNDVGFADVVRRCIAAVDGSDGYGCSHDDQLRRLVDARIARLGGQGSQKGPDGVPITPIATVITTIHRAAPNATIYLAGYPQLFGAGKSTYSPSDDAPSGYVCRLNTLGAVTLDYADAQWLNRRGRALNAVYRQAVARARQADPGLRAKYVKVSTFAGHGVCDEHERWINKISLELSADARRTLAAADRHPRAAALVAIQPRPESLHPNVQGQRDGYQAAFARAGLGPGVGAAATTTRLDP